MGFAAVAALSVCFSVLASGEAPGPEPSRSVSVNASVVRSISTNGRGYAETENWMAFGLVAANGQALRAYGLSLGALQYATMDGWSTAVGYVWATHQLRGLSTAAVLSYAGDLRGVQIAGGSAAATRARGLQLAGGSAVCVASCQGLQLSALNVAGELEGLQLGAVNIGGNVRGVQLGVINIARESDLSLGLVNIIYGIPVRVSLTANEWTPLNVSLKTGSRFFYNQLQLGYAFRRSRAPARWSAAYGLGIHPLAGRPVSFQVELLGGAYFNDTPDLSSEVKGGFFASLSAPVVVQLRERLALLVGPQLTVLRGRAPTPRVPFPTIVARSTREDGTPYETKFWPGLMAGVQL